MEDLLKELRNIEDYVDMCKDSDRLGSDEIYFLGKAQLHIDQLKTKIQKYDR